MSEPFILPAGCLDPDRIAAAFATYGVVVLPGMFSSDDLAPADQALQAWASGPDSLAPRHRNPAFDLHQTKVVSWHPIAQGHACFATLRDHPRLAAATAAAIGVGAWGDGCMVMLSRPGHGQAWHQDTDREEPGQYFVNRLLYPWDVDPAAGALVCVPGSHRAGPLPPGEPHGEIAGERLLAPSAGTLVLVHSRCYHRVTANRTQGLRVSVNFRVHPADADHDLGGIGVYRTGAYDFRTDQPAGTPAA